jgi:hypothetical protein
MVERDGWRSKISIEAITHAGEKKTGVRAQFRHGIFALWGGCLPEL